MRGNDPKEGALFSYVSAEQRVPQSHPLRPIRQMVDQALTELTRQFDRLYAKTGRPSIAPEQLLRALLLQVLYSIRSERMLMEQLDYNLLFRWFVGLNMDDRVWDATTFTKNRERFLTGDIATAFFEKVLEQAGKAQVLSDEHFTVDGTLVQAWASQKSFRPREDGPQAPGGDEGNVDVDYRGHQRSNATHASTTDPEARLYRKSKGQEAKLCYLGHILAENRHGLIVDARLTQATGTAEREAALEMVETASAKPRITLGADKGYDVHDFVVKLREMGVTPHIAQRISSAVDGRTTRHSGYAISQQRRKKVEEPFGWMKTVGLLRQVRHRGRALVEWVFTFSCAAYNLVRLRNLAAERA